MKPLLSCLLKVKRVMEEQRKESTFAAILQQKKSSDRKVYKNRYLFKADREFTLFHQSVI